MDPLTHGLAGAIASQSFSEKKKIRPASITGFVAALLADMDTFISSPADPLLNIEIHRQFTHSLIFIPAGALIATILLWLVMKKHLTLKEIYLYSLAGFATSGLLDACTSYGTQLLWPFLDTRFAWNLISIIDPVLTLGLLFFVGRTVYKRTSHTNLMAWAWLFLILSAGWFQQTRAEISLFELAGQRGHSIDQYVVKPTIGNRVLWRATYTDSSFIYTDAVRPGLFSSPKIYEGEAAPKVNIAEDYSSYTGTVLYGDLQRFSDLSKGYLVRHPDHPDVIGDARYSMLPTSMVPLWGVEADTSNTDKHLPFLYFRDAGEEIRQPFWDMLLGK
ncbi:MAG: metal-dependent hydrolase [Balneolaceae bacterium]